MMYIDTFVDLYRLLKSKASAASYVVTKFFFDSEVGENTISNEKKSIVGSKSNDFIYDNNKDNVVYPKSGIDKIVNSYSNDSDVFVFEYDDKKISVKNIGIFEKPENTKLESKTFNTLKADHIVGINPNDKIEIKTGINKVDSSLNDGLDDNSIAVEYAFEKGNDLIIVDDKDVANSLLVLYDQDENIGSVELNGIIVNDIANIDGYFISSDGEVEFY